MYYLTTPQHIDWNKIYNNDDPPVENRGGRGEMLFLEGYSKEENRDQYAVYPYNYVKGYANQEHDPYCLDDCGSNYSCCFACPHGRNRGYGVSPQYTKRRG